jgi:hypothetical protein
VSKLADMRGPGRSRRARFRARLPTNLPGISFTARGRVWFKQDLSAYPAIPLREAKASTLAGAYEMAKAVTEAFEPEAAFHAEQAVAADLADWQPLKESPVRVRAALSLDLAAEDAAKAERFTESRRAGRLDEALARDHMKFIREVALADEQAARLWWLHLNLAGDSPETSWNAFNDMVRPLIRISDEDDPLNRLAQALLTLNGYIHEDPKRLQTLATAAAYAAAALGEEDLPRALIKLLPPMPGQPNASGPSGDTEGAGTKRGERTIG